MVTESRHGRAGSATAGHTEEAKCHLAGYGETHYLEEDGIMVM